MADLIDRKELRDALYEADAVTMQGVKIINQFPAVNAVPVVRCRECKKGEVDDPDFPDQYYCHAGCGWNNGDFYCSYGERKEGAE